jgi:hypothetical protein
MLNSPRRGELLCGLLAFLLPLLLYLLWVPLDYSGDDLQQSMTIHRATYGGDFYHPTGGVYYDPERLNEAVVPGEMPVQPRYLLEYPTSILVARLWRAFGWQDGVITPVLLLRALVGALGALLMYATLLDLRRNALVALLATASLEAVWEFPMLTIYRLEP